MISFLGHLDSDIDILLYIRWASIPLPVGLGTDPSEPKSVLDFYQFRLMRLGCKLHLPVPPSLPTKHEHEQFKLCHSGLALLLGSVVCHPDMPTLPGNDMSALLTGLHHFLVKRACPRKVTNGFWNLRKWFGDNPLVLLPHDTIGSCLN